MRQRVQLDPAIQALFYLRVQARALIGPITDPAIQALKVIVLMALEGTIEGFTASPCRHVISNHVAARSRSRWPALARDPHPKPGGMTKKQTTIIIITYLHDIKAFLGQTGRPVFYKIWKSKREMSSLGLVKVLTCENSFMDPCRDLKDGWDDTGIINEQPLAPLALRTRQSRVVGTGLHRTTQYGSTDVRGTPRGK